MVDSKIIQTYLFLGTLNQYSGRIFFFPYDITDGRRAGGCVAAAKGRPILNRRYRGGSEQALAARGISSAKIQYIGFSL